MPYGTDLECGEELARDIESGLIAEDQLTESGKRKLAAYRAAPFFHVETYTEFAESMQESLEFLGFPKKELTPE
jgi:hypothetical protein